MGELDAKLPRKVMNIKVLQYLMGHAHSDVTMDVYNHIAGREDVKEEVGGTHWQLAAELLHQK